MNKKDVGVIKTLLYYDIFDYPLTADEIRDRFPLPISGKDSLTPELDNLVGRKLIHQLGPFYGLCPLSELVPRRQLGNRRARKSLKLALRIGRFIGSFPFIKSVMLSGSISKGYMDPGSDIDFFLVTKPGRLWVARTFLVLFKRLFLFNSHKYFCVNYFIDSDHLEIEDKNLFTATEITTLIPAYNLAGYSQFIQSNRWVRAFYPNFQQPADLTSQTISGISIKQMVDFLLANRLGDFLEKHSQKMTQRRWLSKFSHFPKDDFERAFRSREYASKNHRRDFQKVVCERYEKKIRDFEKKHSIELS